MLIYIINLKFNINCLIIFSKFKIWKFFYLIAFFVYFQNILYEKLHKKFM